MTSLSKIHIDEVDINLFTECSDRIRFTHKKYIDSPDNHRFHLNNLCEVYVCMTEKVKYIVEDVCYALQPGDIVVMKPYEVHSVRLPDNGWYERFYFLIPLNAFPYMDHNPLHPILDKATGSRNLISLPPEQRAAALHLLYQISSLATQTEHSIRLLAYSYFLQFLSVVDTHLSATKEPGGNRQMMKLPKLIREILVYMERNITQLEHAGKIAAHFQVSLPYLSTLFKKHLNIGINHYVRSKKIEVAKKLLYAGHSVTYTCYECGFNDCSYFIKTFKHYTGMTPAQYQSSVPLSLLY